MRNRRAERSAALNQNWHAPTFPTAIFFTCFLALPYYSSAYFYSNPAPPAPSRLEPRGSCLSRARTRGIETAHTSAGVSPNSFTSFRDEALQGHALGATLNALADLFDICEHLLQADLGARRLSSPRLPNPFVPLVMLSCHFLSYASLLLACYCSSSTTLSATGAATVPVRFASRYARINGSRSPSSTRSTSPTSNRVRRSLII